MKKYFNTDITIEHVNEEVTLYGWIANKRKFKKQHFIDLRDRSGLIQVILFDVTDPKLTKESSIKVTGIVKERLEYNTELKTGQIEIHVTDYEVLNSASQLPFEIMKEDSANEDLRLEYRFLDLRSEKMQYNIALRHKVNMETRKFFDKNGFLEIETPILCKSTPEGARDFLVPTRRNGKFFALPQSPQLYKQLLMASGYEKYFQIARVFRDEDLRKDRQPEFTQIDFEMSFADREDLFALVENYYKHIWNSLGMELKTPFPRMGFFESMDKYGNDKPDTRFENLLTNVKVFDQSIHTHKSIAFENIELISKKDILFELGFKNNAENMTVVEFENSKMKSKVFKGIQLTDEYINEIIAAQKLISGSIIISLGEYDNVVKSLGALRTFIAEEYALTNPNQFNFVWIVDWPMFEYNKETNEYEPAHHAFTRPDLETLKYIETNEYDKVRACSYDIVLNGFELGSGSVRNHDAEMQQKIFEYLKMSPKEYNDKFGFFLNAFKYGLPPHLGMAFGLERILMIISNSKSIRDVIAFPKNAKGLDLLSKSPSNVTEFQLDEYGLKLK
ncbi:aspartate--tRNA ligase [Mycoplasma phocoenae]|uniref:Aspartate--tRNA ligase n=1 Tax=Mycoplasma phocoenae TaxID=754517 RepID=A0A858U6X2_9MOLU|nr:aspartate--tRNA ligase [Mycoplasma phocoenae]QJG67015.1 aspartate--tRNA ligase [Mycoplasma phocoenae]